MSEQDAVLIVQHYVVLRGLLIEGVEECRREVSPEEKVDGNTGARWLITMRWKDLLPKDPSAVRISSNSCALLVIEETTGEVYLFRPSYKECLGNYLRDGVPSVRREKLHGPKRSCIMSQDDAVLIAQHYASHELSIEERVEQCRHEVSPEDRMDGSTGARWLVTISSNPGAFLVIEETTGEVYLTEPFRKVYIGNYLRDSVPSVQCKKVDARRRPVQ